jgi:hypothetical protein
VHDPLQSALHLVVHVAVVGTLTHVVVQLSLQHAPHDAVHSAIDDAEVVVVIVDASGVEASGANVASASSAPPSVTPPSRSSVAAVVVVVVVEADAEQEALHPDSQRWLQSVVQSNMAGLVEHEVVHIESQLEVQVVAAVSVHRELQDCSSWAAQALTHVAGAHCVVQLLLVTISQFALASMSMLPHSLTTVARASCASAVSAVNGIEAIAQRAQGFFVIFMVDTYATHEPSCFDGSYELVYDDPELGIESYSFRCCSAPDTRSESVASGN